MKKILIAAVVLLLAAPLLFGQQKKAGQQKAAWVLDKSVDGILPGVNSMKVTGPIVMAGSSTVYPLSERIAERFRDEGYAGNITLDSIGTGAGFERFCVAGETDISNASRPIKQNETESARKIGREPIEFRIGTDALAVVVNKQNSFIKSATKSELGLLFSSAKQWSDVNPSWPKRDIVRFIPGTDSGTFDYFVEEIFKKDKKQILGASNLQLSEDDNVLVQGIEGSPYAIGFFGYAYFQENKDKLTILSIEGVAPSTQTVDNATYPLARPLFIYSDAKIMREKPQVAAFIDFYLTYVNDEIRKVGYFTADPAALKKAKQTWITTMTGYY